MEADYDARYLEIRDKVRYEFDCSCSFGNGDELTSLVDREEDYVFLVEDLVAYFEDLYCCVISIYPDTNDFAYIKQWLGTVDDLSQEIWGWSNIAPHAPKVTTSLQARYFELTVTKDIILRLEKYADEEDE